MKMERPGGTFSLVTPLGPDVLRLHTLQTTEGLSQLSEFTLDMLSEREDIDANTLLGQRISVHAELPDHQTRYFTGYVTRFAHVGMRGRYHHYQADVRPWLWFLTRKADCRIFQNQTAPEIIKTILAEHPLTDHKSELTGNYRKRGYCVQYRETDFDFISRLMEEEGIYYYFRHGERSNTLVLVDSSSAHVPYPGYEQLPFIPQERQIRPEQEFVHAWAFRHTVQSGKVVLTDYDFQRPSVDLRTTSTIPREHAQADGEIFDYPGTYFAGTDGEHYAKTRIEALHAGHECVDGASNARGIAVGHLFKLTGHPRSDQNRDYLIVSTQQEMKNSEYESQAGTGATYTGTFTAQDRSQPYRPPRTIRKPAVQGLQTGIVVGPAGDEIHTDAYGRVKVRFHWDRHGQADENSSCWMRVSHPWAGKQWGMVALPRVGQEVIIDFLEGDPDRPIITGRVANAEQMPSAFSQAGELPDNKALAGLKSRELAGLGYNELLFDDTSGELRAKLSSEHSKAQLNLGYLTHPRVGGHAEPRGEGFELRSDAWGTLRAAKGLFLSADGRAQAVGGQLSRDELVRCLEEALVLAKSLSEQAGQHQATATDNKPQEQLAQAAKDWGHGANAEKNGANGGAAILAASAPAGIALTTLKSLTSFTGLNTDLVAQQNHQFTSGQQTLLNSGTGISLYADSGGIKSIANRGKQLIQAQQDDVVINADKSIHLTASHNHILVAAEEHITLTAGGAYIKLAGGNIELGCPGSVLIKAANYALSGPASLKEALPTFSQGETGRQFVLNHGQSSQIAANKPYKITLDDGQVIEGVTDAAGHTELLEKDTLKIAQIQILKPNGN